MHNPRFARAAAVCGCLSLMMLFGCGAGMPLSSSSLLAVGQVAPELWAEGWLNGSAPSEEDLAGRVLVMEVWAYW